MTVYIIVHGEWNTIESVWDTRLAAESARDKLARQSETIHWYYEIIERVVNQEK